MRVLARFAADSVRVHVVPEFDVEGADVWIPVVPSLTLDAPQRIQEIPMGRYGKPEEVAAAVLFLASNEASFVSSASLMISGAR